MKYIDFRNIYGRFANQLYLCLQTYIERRKTNEDVKYLTNDYFRETHQYEHLKYFNLENFVELNNIINSDIIHLPSVSLCQTYRQHFGVNFTESELNDFIKYCILPYGRIKTEDKDTAIGIHIRLGDYETSPISPCFDKGGYINKCLSVITDKISVIKVFSDDIEKCKPIMDNVNGRFEVVYSNNTTDIDDFIELSQMKNKILWNSTFSYWTAFISNVLYENSYKNIFVPSKFTSIESNISRINPKWNVIEV